MALEAEKELNFDFTQEFDHLLERFQEFQEVALTLNPTWEKELDKIEDRLLDINSMTKDKKQIPVNAWNRLKRLLKSSEIQDQPSIKKEREALKTSYEKIARWLGLIS